MQCFGDIAQPDPLLLCAVSLTDYPYANILVLTSQRCDGNCCLQGRNLYDWRREQPIESMQAWSVLVVVSNGAEVWSIKVRV